MICWLLIVNFILFYLKEVFWSSFQRTLTLIVNKQKINVFPQFNSQPRNIFVMKAFKFAIELNLNFIEIYQTLLEIRSLERIYDTFLIPEKKEGRISNDFWRLLSDNRVSRSRDRQSRLRHRGVSNKPNLTHPIKLHSSARRSIHHSHFHRSFETSIPMNRARLTTRSPLSFLLRNTALIHYVKLSL